MIRNSLAILLLLVFSTLGAYFFIELPEYKSLVESNRKLFFLRDIKISRIHFKNFCLEYRGDDAGWVNPNSNENKIDEIKVEVFISRLRKLKMIKKVDRDHSYNLSSKISLETPQGKLVELKLGDKQPFSERFYMSFGEGNKKSIYLVQDTSPQVDAIPDYLFSINPLKHRALFTGFNSNNIDWVFDGIIETKPNVIKFAKNNAPTISIDLNSFNVASNSLRNHTSTIIEKGKIKHWFEKIQTLRASKILKNWGSINKRYLGSMQFDHETHGVSVFVESRFGKEVYLQKSGTHPNGESLIKVFPIDNLKTIFPHVQDFIQKQLLSYENGLEYQIEFLSDKNNSYELLAKPVNEKLKIESTGISEKKLIILSQMTKKLFSDANYLNFGNELTIKPELSLKMKVNKKNYDYAYAHGVLEIFDHQNKMSFFYQDHKIKDLINEARL